MSAEDQQRWDGRYVETGASTEWSIPSGFTDVERLFPVTGRALDVACGAGQGSVWLAQRGLWVLGVDVSAVAIEQSTHLAEAAGVGDRCEFVAHDLDLGLPDGPLVDLVTCHLFSARSLDELMVQRLDANGVLAITVLSEVGGTAGPFRAAPGELLDRFGRFEAFEVVHHAEASGRATLVGVAAGPQPHGRLD